ncbi:MAG TPA: ArsR family transcriptional regulator [Thermoplasmata archaeon]|nr:ArsR family transcriptional regulator [Thermoplasmata archaeon]
MESLSPMVETTGVCQILRTLYKHREMLTSKLQRKLPISSETFYKAKNILEKHGPIEVVPTASGKIKLYRLTEKEKGRKIAE